MPSTQRTTSRACSNLATIKYWGNRDDALRLPVNSSLSLNLDGLTTTTTVEFRDDLAGDVVSIGGELVTGKPAERVSAFLDHVRKLAGKSTFAQVESANNFPMGAGIASSASAFAALALAASTAIGLHLSERELSILARLGSGSASRSIPGGFVEWYVGADHESSYAETFAPADHWPLIDLIAIVSTKHKETGSTEGHSIAATSPFQAARVAGAPERVAQCKAAILARDFEAFADVTERDSTLMHAVMMTGNPALFYWQPASLRVMDQVRMWRRAGIPVCYTLDAGANVHCLTLVEHADALHQNLREVEGVQNVLRAGVGGAATLLE
jgi:diphosphomevalonate decarboxylase